MDGVHPLRCVEWRWCAAAVLPQCSGVARALLIPLQCWRVLLSCRALFFARYCAVVWCGVVCVVFVWWGILCPLPPRRGGGWGHRGWWGAVVVVGGMVSEGRLCCWLPRFVRGVPLVVHPVVLLNGGGGMCCDAPSSNRVRHFALSYSPSYCPVPLCVLCHSIVGLGLCHCDRVVSLLNSGDGLRWVAGRVVSAVVVNSCVLWCAVLCVGCGMAVAAVRV